MKFCKAIPALVLFLMSFQTSQAQEISDSTKVSLKENNIRPQNLNWQIALQKKRFPVKSLILPAFMFAYGVASLEVGGLENLNEEIKEDIYSERPHRKVNIDNYLQFAPAAAVYTLNAIGIKGKNNFRDRTMIYLLSNSILGISVSAIKRISHEMRPDGSAFTTFPSGHTAEAFASAEFLRMEYKDISPWYGIAGYAVATATGYLRMYNNRHWLSDVVAGAGVGIASTKIAYWLYPKIQQKLFKDKKMNTVLMPVYQNQSMGFALVHKF